MARGGKRNNVWRDLQRSHGAAAKSRQKFKSTVIAVALLVVAAVGFIAYKAFGAIPQNSGPSLKTAFDERNSVKLNDEVKSQLRTQVRENLNQDVAPMDSLADDGST